MNNTNCPFCNRLKIHINKLKSLNKNFNLPNKNFILEESKKFFITQDCHPICVNHFLIVSKAHSPSFCKIINDIENIKIELSELINLFSKNMQLPCTLIFEHGEGTIKDGANTISHAHLHFILKKWQSVPLLRAVNKIRIDYPFLKEYFLKNHNDFYQKTILNNYSYLFLSDLNENYYFANKSGEKIQSQYLRMVFAKLIQKNKLIVWDWKNLKQAEKEKLRFFSKATLDNLANYKNN